MLLFLCPNHLSIPVAYQGQQSQRGRQVGFWELPSEFSFSSSSATKNNLLKASRMILFNESQTEQVSSCSADN